MGQLFSTSKILSYNEAINRLSQEELDRLKRGWRVLTTSNSRGVVEKKTFIKEVLGSHIPPVLADRIYLCFDLSGNGFLNYKDFISGMTIFSRGTSEEKMQFVFSIFDISKSKKISVEEMTEILKEDNILSAEKSSIDQIVKLCFAKFDTDNDGKLTFQELRSWANENKNLTALLSWIFSDANFSNEQKQQQQQQNNNNEANINLLSSGDIRRADLRSNKSLSSFTHFDEKEVKDLERTFKELQKKSQSGKLDKDTLGSIFNPSLSRLLLDRIFSSFDDNLDGYIDAREFVVGMSLLCRGEEQKKLKFWFNIFDIDGDSFLSRSEMLSMVSSLWKSQSLQLEIQKEIDDEQNLELRLEEITRSSTQQQVNTRNHLIASGIDEQDYLRMEKLVESAFEEFGIPSENKISFQQFQDWFKRTPIAIEFLDAIKRMSNVVLGLKPSSLDEEREIVKELIDCKMKAGEAYYVLSFKWFSLWKDSVGFDDGEKKKQIEVGPIDNAKLLDRKSKNKLRQNLMENHDYLLLPERAWNVLWNWYGGGPTIARQVINLGDENKPFVELYPYNLKIFLIKSTVIQQPVRVLQDYSISKKDTLFEFKKDISKRLNIDDHLENLRIWNYFYESKPQLIHTNTDDELALTLEDVKIVNNQKIVFEVKTEEGMWPLENASTSNEQLALQPGLVGLNNLGNTCFMNSAIQSLSNTQHLTQYFLTNRFRSDINKTNRLGMQGEVAKSYANLIKKMWQGDGKEKIFASYAPRDFKRIIGRFAPQFSGSQQHDSQEFLDFLLNGLHEDLNLIKEKPYVENPNNDGVPDPELAQLFWEAYLKRNQSVIVDLFQGQLKSSLICNHCNYNSVTFDPFTFLSIPLPMDEICLIEIIVHLYDQKQVPVKYSVRMSSESHVFEMKQELSKLCNLKPKQLLLCEVQRHYVFRELGDLARIKSIQSPLLHAYQITSKSLLQKSTSSSSAIDCLQSPNRNHDIHEIEIDDDNNNNHDSENRTRSPINNQQQQQQRNHQNKKNKKKKRKKDPTTIRHIPFLHRYLQPQTVYFFSPFKVVLFGVPVIISIRSNITIKELYELLEKQLSRYVKFFDDYKLSDNSLDWRKRYPFTLKFVSKNGDTCGLCSWNKFCLGCELDDDSFDLKRINSHTTFAIEWKHQLLISHYDSSLAKAFVDHQCVEENRRIMEQPISLIDCLNLFTVEERLSKDEAWYCPKCKDFQAAVKRMSLWKLPPFLIIHLKRFHYNGHSFQKISKLVDFPLKNLNLAPYTESNQPNVTYNLYSVLNHFGGLGRGHYVTYASNSNKWYTFDDSRVSEMDKEKVISKSAYVLFYSLVDVNDVEFSGKMNNGNILHDSTNNTTSPGSFCKIM